MIKDQLLEKIKKLLALSNSSNPHEAAAALLRAQKLMQMYNIEKDSLFDDENDVSYIEVLPIRGLKSKAENQIIGAIIARAFGVEFFYSTTKSSIEKIMFFGPKDILESCEYIYTILARALLIAKKKHAIGVKTEVFEMICNYPKKELNRLLSLDDITHSDLEKLKSSIKDIKDSNLKNALEGSTVAMKNMKTADKMISSFLGDYSVIQMYIQKYVKQSNKGFCTGFLTAIYNNVALYKNDIKTKKRISKVVEEYFHGANIKTTQGRGYAIKSQVGYNAYKKGVASGSSVSICTAIKNRAKTREQLTLQTMDLNMETNQ